MFLKLFSKICISIANEGSIPNQAYGSYRYPFPNFKWCIHVNRRLDVYPTTNFYREICFFVLYSDKKEEIWPSPMTKAPTPTEMSKGQSDNTNNATKKFD